MNDHLTDVVVRAPRAQLEALTAMAALAHRVPGKWLGHGVLSATFRHPAVLAKAATVMDHATGGRFIVGLGAGWHEGEHLPFGIPMPPMPERFDRFESAVHVLRALWSAEAATPPGVTRPDPFYPLDGATNEPPPLTPGGPPLWLGGQKRRGIALAAAVADGWLLPAVVALGKTRPTSTTSGKRDAFLRGPRRDRPRPGGFEIAAQVPTGDHGRRPSRALAAGREAVGRGATHVILGMPPRLGAAGVDDVAAEIAEPLREALGMTDRRSATAAASDDADLATLAAIVNTITPDDPTSLERDALGGRDVSGRPSGSSPRWTAGRWGARPSGGSTCTHPSSDALWAYDRRPRPSTRRGDRRSRCSTPSRTPPATPGRPWLHLRTSEAPPEGIAFLAHRGFTELERARRWSGSSWRAWPPPAIEPPTGVTLTTLAERPELVDGVHAVAIEAFADIPGGDEPMAVGDLAEFRARDVDRPGIPPGAFMIAMDAATGRSHRLRQPLSCVPGSTTVAWHDMTAVARAWRGRGLATALKAATIAWAIDHGLTALETGNDVENAPMRAVNARLGYRPLPDVTMRGPLRGRLFSAGA